MNLQDTNNNNHHHNDTDDSKKSQVKLQYKVYKRRWLLLLIPVGAEILLFTRSWRFPIVNIVYPFWDATVTQAVAWITLPLLMEAILIIPAGLALDRWGIRRMIYYTGPLIIVGYIMQSIILFDESSSPIWLPIEYRFVTFIISNCFVMIAHANFCGLTAKLANDWFPLKETTLVLALPQLTGRLMKALVAFVTPRIVKTSHDLRYIGYSILFLVSIYAIIILTCVTRSQPKIPPSKNAQLACDNIAPTSSAFINILKMPAFVIAMLCFGLNVMSIIILDTVFSDALSMHGYTNDFAGTLMMISCITSCVGLLSSAWLDIKFDYIRVSKIASLLFAASFTVHFMGQLRGDFEYVIVPSGIVQSFSLSVLIPLQLQAMLRSSKGLLPDASMAALNMLVAVSCFGILTVVLSLTKKITPNSYFKPYMSFCIIICVINCIYAFWFNPPKVRLEATSTGQLRRVQREPGSKITSNNNV